MDFVKPPKPEDDSGSAWIALAGRLPWRGLPMYWSSPDRKCHQQKIKSLVCFDDAHRR